MVQASCLVISAGCGEGGRDAEAAETFCGMIGSPPLPPCSLRAALAIAGDSGFTKKRRKKTQAEGKKLMGESTPSGRVEAGQWAPWSCWPKGGQWPRRGTKGQRTPAESAPVLNIHVPTVIHSDRLSIGIHIPISCNQTLKIRKSKVTCPRSHSI